MLYIIKVVAAILLCAAPVFAQFEPHPELEWYTIETPHFYIHYHKGAERTANTAAKIAEESYGPITSLYKYEPNDKVSFVISDVSDYGNGATDYYGNRIEIYATTLDVDFRMRGTHNWLRNVITHEFTHIVQIQSAMKFARKIPGIYLQWLNYEDERRPDVLYGYPNVIVSYPISGVSIPAWFAEGTAQYQRQQTGYDSWDSHRDMLLRMRTLGGNLLSWEEMGQFSSITTYKAESIYNQGFNLIRYIAWKYGEDKLKEISDHLGDIVTANSESAFKKSIGKSGKDLYNEWKEFTFNDYKRRTIELNAVEGTEIVRSGFANYYPRLSPDGKKVSYLSNKTSDYSVTSLYIRNLGDNSKEELLVESVPVNYSWSPDGKKILFSRRNPATIHGVRVFDLYEYDLNSKKQKKLSHNLRAHSPSYSPDGKSAAFVFIGDGTQNLGVAELDGGKINSYDKITHFYNGEQIFNPVWSPDGKFIIFDYSLDASRSISRIELSSGKVDFLFKDEKNSDFRDAAFSEDGKYLLFASDKTGIFNIYSYDIEKDSVHASDRVSHIVQLTNVPGGAFMPAMDDKGILLFSSFSSTGYKINKIAAVNLNDTVQWQSHYDRPEKVLYKYSTEDGTNLSGTKNKFDWEKLKNFDDRNVPQKESRSYREVASPLFFVPVLRFDNYTKSGKFADVIKPGLYFFSTDMLGRMGIFGGLSLNRRFERDLFLQFEYNNGVPFFKDFFNKKLSFVPRFDIAGYNTTRKTDASFIAGIYTIDVDITYDLLQFDFQMAFKIINLRHEVKTGFTFSRYTSKVGTFIFPGLGQIPAFSTNYFTGRDLSVQYNYEDFASHKNDDINPIGRYFKLKYDYEFNSLNPTLQANEQGQLVEVFQKANFHRLEGDWFESAGLFNSHSASLSLKGGLIFGQQQDNFFDFYASGFPGMKGYPFYAIGGNRYFSANITYRLPLFQHLDFKFLQFYFDKIYFSLYGDAGNAWNGKEVKLSDFKKDIGAEVRLQLFSWYLYPTSVAFNAAYGLDEFEKVFPSTTGENKTVKYGKEWRLYFTMLFGFDFFDAVKKAGF